MAGYRTWRIGYEAGLTALASRWSALWRRSPGATPFQSPEWLIPWWRAFAPGELFILAVSHGDHLVGLAPFYVEASSSARRLLPLGISISDYLDVLVDPEHFAAVGRLILAELQSFHGWDVAELAELAPDASGLRLPRCPNLLETVEPAHSCPVLMLPETVDALRSVLPKRKMRSLHMARNRAERRGQCRILRAGNDALDGVLSTLFRLHAMRWQEEGEPGVLADVRVQDFHRAAAPGLMNAGWLRLYGLEISGSPAGAYYGFMCRGRAFAYLHGFHPSFAFEGPGTILIGHAIAEAVREGAREFDFLRGREAYKYHWGAKDRWTQRRTFRRAAVHARAS
jgi:CelD/BcsL family acetyltransferase involved in cellulose biosynthesis